MTWKQRIAEANRIGKRSWMIITCDIVNHDALSRDKKGRPMCIRTSDTPPAKIQRFRQMADGFVQLDAEIIGDELKILSNSHVENPDWPETKPFHNPIFVRATTITWEQFLESFKAYVQGGIERAENLY